MSAPRSTGWRKFAQPILFAGFSFGSVMGLSAGCGDSRVAGLIGLGLPVSAAGRDYTYGFLANCIQPKLFISGDHDEFSSAEVLNEVWQRAPEPRHSPDRRRGPFLSGNGGLARREARAYAGRNPRVARGHLRPLRFGRLGRLRILLVARVGNVAAMACRLGGGLRNLRRIRRFWPRGMHRCRRLIARAMRLLWLRAARIVRSCHLRRLSRIARTFNRHRSRGGCVAGPNHWCADGRGRWRNVGHIRLVDLARLRCGLREALAAF